MISGLQRRTFNMGYLDQLNSRRKQYSLDQTPQQPGFEEQDMPNAEVKMTPEWDFKSYTPSLSQMGPNGKTSNGIDMAQLGVAGASGAATGAAMGAGTAAAGGAAAGSTAAAAGAGSSLGPWGAAIAIAGSLASQYLGQKAADARAKRDRAVAIEKGYGEDQQQAINQIMANNARALR